MELADHSKISINKPKWLRVKLPIGENYKKVRALVDEHNLHTICQSGNCPNMGECWGEGTATFMILGNICTRSCGFCSVATGKPIEADQFEPAKVAQSIKLMNIKHAVITSVDRDDLKDGGADHFVKTIMAIRMKAPETTVEILPGDFKGKIEDIDHVISAKPDVFNHNLETVPRLYPTIRPGARYFRFMSSAQNLRMTAAFCRNWRTTVRGPAKTLRRTSASPRYLISWISCLSFNSICCTPSSFK